MLRVKTIPAVAEKAPDPNARNRILAACQLDQIPALQALVQGFTKAANRRDVTVDEVVESISKDPALCVRILRMANSTEVNSEQRIESLETAVQMLGVDRVREAAEAMLILRSSTPKPGEIDMRQLWIHALATATIAEHIEKKLRGKNGPQVYLAGLLHDVGKIVLSLVEPDEYRGLLVKAWQDNQALGAIEQPRLGVDHSEAGVVFAVQNRLSELIVQAIAYHGDPTKAASHHFEVAIVSIANKVAKLHSLGFSGSPPPAGVAFADFPEWPIITAELGQPPDLASLGADLDRFTARLGPQLNSLLEEG